MGGGQDKLAWTAYPPPLQLSIQNNATKKTAEFDLNYVYNWYIITFRKFKMRKLSKKFYFDTMRKLSKKFYFDTLVGGEQDKLAWTANPPPL